MQKRRDFLKIMIQGSILTGLTFLSSYLIFRKGGEDANCDFDFVCRNCKKHKNCSIPQAEEYRIRQSEISKHKQNG